jgi:hypothetical protein
VPGRLVLTSFCAVSCISTMTLSAIESSSWWPLNVRSSDASRVV